MFQKLDSRYCHHATGGTAKARFILRLIFFRSITLSMDFTMEECHPALLRLRPVNRFQPIVSYFKQFNKPLF